MKNGQLLTREKHLDHMVKVVPIITIAYFAQCYMITQIGPSAVAINGIFFLGACLAFMITGFITYDLTHCITIFEDHLQIEIKWLNYSKVIQYKEISEIHVTDPGQSFSHIIFKTQHGEKIKFYFMDEADKIKAWIENQKSRKELLAA